MQNRLVPFFSNFIVMVHSLKLNKRDITLANLFYKAGYNMAFKQETKFPVLEANNLINDFNKENTMSVNLTSAEAAAIAHIVSKQINDLANEKQEYTAAMVKGINVSRSLELSDAIINQVKKIFRNRSTRLSERITNVENLQIKLKKIARANIQ